MADSYKIPQNVDLEDKIFGPFTLKQFLMLLAGGVVTFVNFSVWFTAFPGVFYLLTFLAWGVVLAFIFIRPNEQPFSKFFTSFIWFASKPQRRTWKRIPSLDQITLKDENKVPKVVKRAPTPDEIHSKLSRLAHVVDTRGWSDVDETDINARVTSGEAKPEYNIEMTEADKMEVAEGDILAKEDGERGGKRASDELDRALKQDGGKPSLHRDVKHPTEAR